MNFVEYGKTDNDASDPVFPDPLILDVELQWELSNFCRKCVREFHGTSNFLSHVCVRLFISDQC